MTTRLARWRFVILGDDHARRIMLGEVLVHAARKLHDKTACGRRFTHHIIAGGWRTINCPGCRAAIGLRVEADPILAVARQVLKQTKRKSPKVGKP